MKKLAKRIILIVIVALFIIIGLKSCIHETWGDFHSPRTYAVVGSDGREFKIIFLPQHETMIWYSNPNEGRKEGILTRTLGSSGTHYFGPIWHSGETLLGLKWLPKDCKLYELEMTILAQCLEGVSEPTFGKVGKTFYDILLVGKNRIKFQGMWLTSIPSDTLEVSLLYSLFQTKKN